MNRHDNISPALGSLHIIARIQTQFPEKFGIPRQSGIVGELEATIVFEPAYRNESAVRGLDSFSHIWLLWGFSDTERGGGWSATVKPPRLGGKTRMGVFATRSPFRPNPIGLSCVQLCAVEHHEKHGFILRVAGADLRDNTPIYDIKPYLPYTDCHPEANGGYADELKAYQLKVAIPDYLRERLSEELCKPLEAVLAHDPRPAYHRESNTERIYGISFAGYNVKFRVDGEVLLVCEIEEE